MSHRRASSLTRKVAGFAEAVSAAWRRGVAERPDCEFAQQRSFRRFASPQNVSPAGVLMKGARARLVGGSAERAGAAHVRRHDRCLARSGAVATVPRLVLPRGNGHLCPPVSPAAYGRSERRRGVVEFPLSPAVGHELAAAAMNSSPVRGILFDWRETLFHDEEDVEWVRGAPRRSGAISRSPKRWSCLHSSEGCRPCRRTLPRRLFPGPEPRGDAARVASRGLRR